MTVNPLATALVCLFAGLALGSYTVVAAATDRRNITRSLELVHRLDNRTPGVKAEQSFVDRVVWPRLQQMAKLGRRLSPDGAAERMSRRLDLAGNPPRLDVQRVFGLKVVGLLVGLLLGYAFAHSGGVLRALLITAGAGAFGFFLPDILIYNSGTKRQQVIQRTIADALDLLTISVEAGLGFDAAVAQVARKTDGPVSAEFFRVLQEMQIGVGRAQAFRLLAERTTVPELQVFISAVVQADKLGIPIASVLREQSKEMRLKRRQRAEEQAQKVPVKILFPMVVFILPSMFIIILGPGAMSIMDTLSP